MTHSVFKKRRNIFRRVIQSASGALAVLTAVTASGAPAADTVDFNDVRRILSQNCFACHGPDAKERKNGGKTLRLDLPESAKAERGGLTAIVPGRPEKSELIARITTTDLDDKMPPPDSGKKLTVEEIALLKKWIAQGAEYARHWSYVQPRRSEPTKVRDAAWSKNAIDQFILARLEREKLTHAPEADRAALIRRVALDLTGLPPTLAEVDDFLADQKPGAYERVVDRLLKKESFGEHWARLWLDQARYADSSGYADDPARTIWGYRDYVIRALNANKPFDRFTLEQIAGDLLENATDDDLVATAFHRNTMTNNEGGTNDEEYRNVAIVDRVNTTMAVWMGTTMACAQCHNHKYDPISQEDYFRLFAILNNTADADRGDESPVQAVFSPEQKLQRTQWQTEIARLEKSLMTPPPELAKEQALWEKNFETDLPWQPLRPAAVNSKAGAVITRREDGAVQFARGGKTDVYTLEVPVTPGEKITALRLEVFPDDQTPGSGVGHANSNFVVTRVLAALAPAAAAAKGQRAPQSISFALATTDFSQKDFDAGSLLDNKDTKNRGWAVAPKTGEPHFLTLIPKAPIIAGADTKLVLTLEQLSKFEHATIAQLRLAKSTDARATEFAQVPAAVLAVLRLDPAKRSEAQRATVREHHLSIAPAIKSRRDELAGLKKKLAESKPYTTVPVMRELAGGSRRKTSLQRRGNFLDLGPVVTNGLPAALHSAPEGAPADRLALARWLVDAGNPLTARVVVNRLWESIYGVGLVRTSEEFGAQGEPPSHPELLDWLAVELMDHKWDVNHVLRLLVTSAAYRQSSRVTPELAAQDPENRLLARGPRFRLSAEMIRDQALFVSGLLSSKMYGPPVKPAQPKLGLTAAFGSGTDWETSGGEDRYRRALYTTWRRSNPYPSMATFDAPNREVCLVRRERSNTPLQALVTLNDPVYFEAAQALARRMAAAGPTPADKARHGFRLCASRAPTDSELNGLVGLYTKTLERFKADPAKAKDVATKPLGEAPKEMDVAELAAWTMVGNVLLNLDEMLMKR